MRSDFVLLAGIFCACSLSAAEKVFELTGDQGLNAKVLQETKNPVSSRNVKTVPGFKGNAIALPENGNLVFDLSKLGNMEKGTVVFFMRFDTPLEATGCYYDRDRAKDGSWGRLGEGMRQIVCGTVPFPICATNHTLYALNTNVIPLNFYKRVFPYQWHFAAFSWDKTKKRTASMLDFSYKEGELDPKRIKTFGKRVLFGSENGRTNGFSGAIDEFAVYNDMLTERELLDLYNQLRKVDFECRDYAVNAGKEARIRLLGKNFSRETVKRTLKAEFTDKTGKKIAEDSVSVDLKPGDTKIFTFKFRPEKAGLYQIRLDNNRIFELLAIDDKTVESRMKVGELDLKLVEEIDCTKNFGAEKFLCGSKTKVVDGKYREGANVFRGAFAYRLNKIRNPKRWHILEIEYPDDAVRAFSVHTLSERWGLSVSGQMNGIGVITGGESPLTYRMQTKRLLFIPYSENVGLIAENYDPKQSEKGAALSRIRIYEHQGEYLPKQYPTNGSRDLGIWEEDLAMHGTWLNPNNMETNVTLEFWQKKAELFTEYCKYAGMTNWTFQPWAYQGDRSGHFITLPADVSFPGHNGHIPGWCDVFAKVFERDGIKFYGRIALFPGMSYPRYLCLKRLFGPGKVAENDAEYSAMGTKSVQTAGPNGVLINRLNPIHPDVVAMMKRIVREYRDHFVTNPYFQGLTFRESREIFSFTGIDRGYDDHTVSLFALETGIKVPGGARDPKRFKARYQFLTSAEMYEKWVSWRCEKFAQMCEEVVKELRKGNNRLCLQTWINFENIAEHSLRKDYRAEKYWREAGYDLKRLAKIEGLDIVPIIRPDYEHVHPRKQSQESYVLYSKDYADSLADIPDLKINMHLHNNLEQYRANVTDLKNWFWRLGNWTFAKKNFHYYSWANCYPDQQFALLPLTNMLANTDVKALTLGMWGFPDSGVHELFRKFYRAYRSIPKGEFKLVSDPDSPAALRVCGTNFYLANKESFPVEISMEHGGLKDLVTGEPFNAKVFTLGPSEVRVFSGSFRNFRQSVKPESLTPLKKRLADLETTAKIIRDPEVDEQLAKAKEYFREGKYGEVRRTFYLKKIVKVLKENKGLKLTAKLLPREVSAEVTVSSFDPEARNVSVWIDKADGCWNADPKNKMNFELAGGGSKTFRIPLKDSLIRDGWTGTVTFAMSMDGGVPVRKTFQFGGHFARYSDISEIGQDWSFGKYKMKESTSADKRIRQMFKWSQGYAWNEKGLFLATVVEDKDYMPADKIQPYTFKSDSMQYFIDGKNKTVYDAPSYDDSVMELIAAESDGKFGVKHCRLPKRGVPAEKSKIRMAYHRENGKSYWELFIPADELPDVQFKKGTVMGAAVMINNRMKTAEGGESFMTNQEIFPYMKPGTWKDLILTDRNGKL